MTCCSSFFRLRARMPLAQVLLRLSTIGLAVAFVLVASAQSALPPSPAGQTIALIGGRIETQTDAGAFDGTVLIRDGVIAAVGRDVVIPEGAVRVDVAGCTVT